MNLIQSTRHIQRLVEAPMDGIYGPVTATAVVRALLARPAAGLLPLTRQIQRLVEAPVDGIYGPVTAAAILRCLDPVAGEVAGPVRAEDLAFDRRTEGNLATLQPGAVAKFRPFLRRAVAVAAAMGADLRVICGARNAADQEQAKRAGRSKASYGWSWHNYGMAIDFGLFRGKSNYLDETDPDLSWTIYSALGALAPGYGLEWGGSWTSIVDSPHFQVDLGRSSPKAADRKLLLAGRWSF